MSSLDGASGAGAAAAITPAAGEWMDLAAAVSASVGTAAGDGMDVAAATVAAISPAAGDTVCVAAAAVAAMSPAAGKLVAAAPSRSAAAGDCADTAGAESSISTSPGAESVIMGVLRFEGAGNSSAVATAVVAGMTGAAGMSAVDTGAAGGSVVAAAGDRLDVAVVDSSSASGAESLGAAAGKLEGPVVARAAGASSGSAASDISTSPAAPIPAPRSVSPMMMSISGDSGRGSILVTVGELGVGWFKLVKSRLR